VCVKTLTRISPCPRGISFNRGERNTDNFLLTRCISDTSSVNFEFRKSLLKAESWRYIHGGPLCQAEDSRLNSAILSKTHISLQLKGEGWISEAQHWTQKGLFTTTKLSVLTSDYRKEICLINHFFLIKKKRYLDIPWLQDRFVKVKPTQGKFQKKRNKRFSRLYDSSSHTIHSILKSTGCSRKAHSFVQVVINLNSAPTM